MFTGFSPPAVALIFVEGGFSCKLTVDGLARVQF
jgi:hypothetical protein